MRYIAMFLLVACDHGKHMDSGHSDHMGGNGDSGAGTADGEDGSSGGDEGGEGEDSAGAELCPQLESGRWEATGSCFGMTMAVDFAHDEASCGFTLSNWSMDHGSLPTGGAMEGSATSLLGEGWTGCSGAAVDGALEGSCGDGCTWILRP